MSIEIVIYPPVASRDSLRKHLHSMGFVKCQHLWDWPEGSLHFSWFEGKDYQSRDGVEATIFRPRQSERDQFGGGEWAVHTRTRASASAFDKTKQNVVVRSLRHAFRGSFYNDWHGVNRYTPVGKDSTTPVGRGICAVYESVLDNLSAVEYSLPGPAIKLEGTSNLSRGLSRLDPSRVVYNALIPFMVAALEYFFGQTFIIMLRYDKQAKLRLENSTRKVEISDAIAISRGKKTIEGIVAEWYSFQNLDSIHTAFKDWFGLETWAIPRRRKKIGRRVLNMDKRLLTLIESRHGVIHRFEFDRGLDIDQTKDLIGTVRAIIDMFVDYLEHHKGIAILA